MKSITTLLLGLGLSSLLYADGMINTHGKNDNYVLNKQQNHFFKKFDKENKKVILDLYVAKNCSNDFKDLESFYKKEKDTLSYKTLISLRKNNNTKNELLSKIAYSAMMNGYKSINCEDTIVETNTAFITSLVAYSIELNSLK